MKAITIFFSLFFVTTISGCSGRDIAKTSTSAIITAVGVSLGLDSDQTNFAADFGGQFVEESLPAHVRNADKNYNYKPH